MIRLFTFLVFISLPFLSAGQTGNYFISHFTPTVESQDNLVHDIIQNDQGIIFMAYNKGVMSFDGQNWDRIKTPGSIFAFLKDKKAIYTGGPGGFGLLQQDNSHQWIYESLHINQPSANIFELIPDGNRLLGIDQDELFSFDLGSRQLHTIPVPEEIYLEHIFSVGRDIFIAGRTVREDSHRLFILSGDSLKQSTNAEFADHSILNMVKAPDADLYLGISDKDELFLYNNGFSPLLKNEKDQSKIQYVDESQITKMAWVNDTLVAVSTLKGGVIFINPVKSKILKIVNSKSGLPDNEIFSMFVDRNEGVWVSHEKGLSRIAPSLPVHTYDHFPGLEGKILSVHGGAGSLYVGTTTGLFYLKKVENVAYHRVHERKPEKKKSFFKRIWPFKKTETDTDKATFEREVMSVDYTFIRVKGINSKVVLFREFNDELYAAGLNGLFRIKGEKSEQILDRPVRFFHYSPVRKSLFVSTYNGELFQLTFDHGRWERHLLFTAQTDEIGHIFEGHSGEIYFCAVNSLFVLSGEDVHQVQRAGQFNNPYFSDTYGIFYHDSLRVMFPSGEDLSKEFLFDEDKDSLQQIENASISQIITGNGGELWLRTTRGWHVMGGPFGEENVKELSFFKNIRYISRESGVIWVVTEDNTLFLLNRSSHYSWLNGYGPFLKNVRESSGMVDLTSTLSFEQEDASLNFEFIQPEYTGLLAIKYQYQLDGIQQGEWSEWSSDYHTIDFPYLPPGEYTLQVRTKDVLGQIIRLQPLTFKVLAPYWKRPWFYALEFAFIGLMLLISIKMKAMGYKYRLVSRLLALLTLITIIELIQVVLEHKFETQTSPVIDFIIQVMVAIMILPVEKILRKYIFKEHHANISELFSLRERLRHRLSDESSPEIPAPESLDSQS